ncbi:AAA family ATPase [Desulfonatronum lacustre]|uniref:AAA family ATPase n=1 Tax=Desulfonatronum lacustre TaxID=66849 RepID=UPI0004B3279D|nr:AAA family ATPase [Desulfonatronum lacustre]
MLDNTTAPRSSVQQARKDVTSPKRKTRTIAVASGKGGAGKTSVAACLAWILAEQGRRVCLVDVDLGLSNVDVLLGITPGHTLEEVVIDNLPMEQAITRVRPGLDVISGGSGIAALTEMTKAKQIDFLKKIKSLDSYDFLLLDNAPGIHRQVVAFCLAAREQVIVVNPEPTSVTDGYALLKVLRQNGLRRPPYILLNKVKEGFDHATLIKRFAAVCKKHLGALILPLGAVPEDPVFHVASTRSVLPVAFRPQAPGSLALTRVANLIVKRMAPETLHSHFHGFWAASLFTMFQGLHLPADGASTASPKTSPPSAAPPASPEAETRPSVQDVVQRLDHVVAELADTVAKSIRHPQASPSEDASEAAHRLALTAERLQRLAEIWKKAAMSSLKASTANPDAKP